MQFPESENESLRKFIEATRRRQKALNYKFGEINFTKVVEIDDGISSERLELILRRKKKSPNSLTIRVYFWEDRWVWIDAREGQKIGWKFEWSFEGRLSGSRDCQDLIECIEQSYSLFLDIGDYDPTSNLQKIWHDVLLKGPVVI